LGERTRDAQTRIERIVRDTKGQELLRGLKTDVKGRSEIWRIGSKIKLSLESAIRLAGPNLKQWHHRRRRNTAQERSQNLG